MKFYFIFSISILIHLLLGAVATYWGETYQNKTARFIEITVPDTTENNKFERQIVRETEQQNKKPKYDFKPRFFSETTKYTEEETRAARSGLSKNRSNSMPPKRPPPTSPSSPDGSRPLVLPHPPVANNLPTPGVSTVGENLPKDIRIGQWTSLNTERYLFYTFFARIEGRVRFHWERGVQQVAETIPPRKLLSQEWVTEIEVILNKEGYFQDVIIHKKSGIDGFDQAAARAFKIGAPFLNPPVELVQNNQVRLKYQISVFYAPPNARL